MLMKKIAAFIVVAGLLVGGSAMADYHGTVTGKIRSLQVKSNVPTQSVVLVLEGSPSLCGDGSPYASILAGDSHNYNGVLSVALAAFLSGKQVTLISNKVGNMCVIQQIHLNQ